MTWVAVSVQWRAGKVHNLCYFLHPFAGSPQFVERPTSLVVLNGTNAIFTCAVVSSPLASEIGWKLGDTILSNGEKATIEISFEEDAEGQRTISSLIIIDVSGYDSDTVECSTMYRVDAAIMFPGPKSTTELSVLGEGERQRNLEN